jgi:DNA-binding NtrC family response regulator
VIRSPAVAAPAPRDIPLLVDHFLKRMPSPAREDGEQGAMDLLMTYDWPGNVRELENVMERALILDESGVIGPRTCPRRSGSAEPARQLVIDTPT